MNRLLRVVLSLLVVAGAAQMWACKSCDKKEGGEAGASPAAEAAGDAGKAPGANPLPAPNNDLKEVTWTNEKTGESKTFKIGDRIQTVRNIGMVSKRFTGSSDVRIEQGKKGTIVAIRSPKGLVDVKWDGGTWKEYVRPQPGQAPAAPQNPADAKSVSLGEFTSPIHAVYLAKEGEPLPAPGAAPQPK
jgi:hypothetical protein